jgi:Phosphotransferase enzyme family
MALEDLAASAWSRLQLSRIGTERIQVLKKRPRSTVYRLEAAGPGGVPVIAKRSRRAQALTERILYEQVLPALCMPSLAYYGFVDEPTGDFAWLFIGCAGGQPYSAAVRAHTALAARWLSLLHTTGAAVVMAAQLPDRGPDYYREHLASAQKNLHLHLGNPAFTAADVAVLEAIFDQCDVLACHWGEVERQCEAMPRTLVHGDFAPKNMRVRSGPSDLFLEPFDWGSAGWGTPALDLAQGTQPFGDWNDWGSPDLDVYRGAIRDAWPRLARQDLEFCAALGKAFRCLYCIDRESEYLGERWVEKPLLNMRLYRLGLAQALRVAGWP